MTKTEKQASCFKSSIESYNLQTSPYELSLKRDDFQQDLMTSVKAIRQCVTAFNNDHKQLDLTQK